jgi:hypothetical protein
MKLVSVFVRLSQVGLGDMEETVYCEAWGLWSERTGRYGGSELKLYSKSFRSALMSQEICAEAPGFKKKRDSQMPWRTTSLPPPYENRVISHLRAANQS